jgi:hypothetical protein
MIGVYGVSAHAIERHAKRMRRRKRTLPQRKCIADQKPWGTHRTVVHCFFVYNAMVFFVLESCATLLILHLTNKARSQRPYCCVIQQKLILRELPVTSLMPLA